MKFEEFDKLEKYLNGELSQADKESVEREIALNEDLKEKLTLLMLTAEAVEASGVKEKLNQIHEELYTKNSSRSLIRQYYFIAAAACISLFLIGWWLYTPDLSNDSLFTQYFETYPDYVTSRNLEEDRMTEAMNYYNEENYGLAVSVFVEVKEIPELKEDAVFYLGMSYLTLNQVPQALEQLQKSVEESPKYQQQARWYLSLTLLKGKKNQEAIEVLSSIQKGQYRYTEARQLLIQLENLSE